MPTLTVAQISAAMFSGNIPKNPSDMNTLRTYDIRTPDQFKAATTRTREFMGVTLWDADPGTRLKALYLEYGRWHPNPMDAGAIYRLQKALNTYLGKGPTDIGPKALSALANGDADQVNMASREARGMKNFLDLKAFIDVLMQVCSYNASTAATAGESWHRRMRRARRNVLVLMGNVSISYNWTSAAMTGGLGMAAAGSALLSDAQKSAALGTARRVVESDWTKASAGLAAAVAGAWKTEWTATQLIPHPMSAVADITMGALEFIYEVFKKIAKFAVDQIVKMWRHADVSMASSIVFGITNLIVGFLAKNVAPLVGSSTQIAKSALIAVQTRIDSVRINRAAADVGIKHEYWRIIDSAVDWGRTKRQLTAAEGVLSGITSVLLDVLAGPLAPLAKLIKQGIELLVSFVMAKLEDVSIKKALDAAQQMLRKLEAYEIINDPGKSDAIRNLARVQLAEANRETAGVRSAAKKEADDLDHGASYLRAFTDETHAQEVRAQRDDSSTESLAKIASRNQVNSFRAESATVEDFLGDAHGAPFTSFLSTLCDSSPVTACVLVTSGVMSDPDLVTHWASGEGPSAVAQSYGTNYLQAVSTSARHLLGSSGFTVTPVPLTPHFDNIRADWERWKTDAGFNRPQVIGNAA